ncbi:MAG TPA: hypothetical protein VNG13_00850 [Mycobacteriales bacterium]|nr:hypothetical protein [Mycobacteriales bacterium]
MTRLDPSPTMLGKAEHRLPQSPQRSAIGYAWCRPAVRTRPRQSAANRSRR